ncbi:DNA-3-methyladenine glycosylase I [Demequina sp.]|uniref:DNA-3-methyladenine glycosylase I n=1 Tax=Demequina sp. TaxID=2050685 RepID=UPI003D11F43C
MITETNDLTRCFGAGDPLYEEYHDHEWGVPVHGDSAIYERIVLEGAQSGLSWITILRKREGYREAFAGFDPAAVAEFTGADIERLLENPGIVRNRQKITSAITNAQAVVTMNAAGESLSDLFWSFQPPARKKPPLSWHDVPSSTDESKALAKALKQRGFVFVGPTTMYASMQACGLVNDHIKGCVALKA